MTLSPPPEGWEPSTLLCSMNVFYIQATNNFVHRDPIDALSGHSSTVFAREVEMPCSEEPQTKRNGAPV